MSGKDAALAAPKASVNVAAMAVTLQTMNNQPPPKTPINLKISILKNKLTEIKQLAGEL